MECYKRCDRSGCKKAKCDHPYTVRGRLKDGTRFSMKLDDFASPRMPPLKRHIVTTKTEADEWVTMIEASILSSVDPRTPYVPPDATRPVAGGSTLTLRKLLDDYVSRHLEVNAVSTVPAAKSRVKVLVEGLGDIPITKAALEDTDIIENFALSLRKAPGPSAYSVSSVNRIMEVLRAALNWGRKRKMHNVMPVTDVFNIRKSAEVGRNRRLSDAEEQKLLTVALAKMMTHEHMFVGQRLHDCIIGALELPIRIGEMLPIQNRDVDWAHHQVIVKWSKTGGQSNSGKRRWVPFEPGGRLAKVLARRKKLGLDAFVFGDTEMGTEVKSIQGAWDALRLMALCEIDNPTFKRRIATKKRKGKGQTQTAGWSAACQAAIKALDLHWHDLRHEGACRLFRDGVDIRTIQLMLGHTTLSQTQKYLNVTDEELRQKMQIMWTIRRERKKKQDAKPPAPDLLTGLEGE